MGVDALKSALPGYAKDTKLNLGSVTSTSQLGEQRLWGTVLACALATRSTIVIRELAEEAVEHLSAEAFEAAKGAASVMAMNNVYYRAEALRVAAVVNAAAATLEAEAALAPVSV
ncbi:hypothetical protein GCM10022254_47570 [Actinomadura meridiana]|uniref:Alkyl hydroperoxide reductase AhpD n=1 Tax=Actinomadura meridiana TaxID=559626 RepID=A0ABP8CB27_9ACTN